MDARFRQRSSTSQLRAMWDDWMCRKGPGPFADPTVFGRRVGGVPEPAVDAYRALEVALLGSGYRPTSAWAYNCRPIAGTSRYSLHSAGIAIDIDPPQNPYSPGHPYAGRLQRPHVEAVLSVRTTTGRMVWAWGGFWKTPDRMHFQLDCGPGDLDIDWSTAESAGSGGDEPGDDDHEEETVLKKGAGGKAVTFFQECLMAWDPKALPVWGPDGHLGSETVAAVRRFQAEFGIDQTGAIDGVTAALLEGQRRR